MVGSAQEKRKHTLILEHNESAGVNRPSQPANFPMWVVSRTILFVFHSFGSGWVKTLPDAPGLSGGDSRRLLDTISDPKHVVSQLTFATLVEW
jgi:hypothetical protein